MSHETNNPQTYPQEEIDRYTEQRTLSDAKLIRKGARYILGHFTITPEQRDEIHRTMVGELSRRYDYLSESSVDELTPAELERETYKSIWRVMALTAKKQSYDYTDDGLVTKRSELSFAEDMGITKDDHFTGFVDFVLVGKDLKDEDLYRHAITVSLDGKYVGISNEPVNFHKDQASSAADVAITDLQIAEGRQTNRFSGIWSKAQQYGSIETTMVQRVKIINILNSLSVNDSTVKTKITRNNRAVYKRDKPYRQ